MHSCFPNKFTPPITFSNSLGHSHIEIALTRSKASVLKSWKYNNPDPVRGAGVLGCHDGSLFLFHYFSLTSDLPPLPSTKRHRERRAPNPLDLTRALPQSGSPSSLSPPPFVTPRSRVVSGITAEQVEAPKVFVDFEDEAGRLKSMLEGRAPKEKPLFTENDSSRASSGPVSSPPSENASLKGRDSNSRGTLPAATPSISFPNSPSTLDQNEMLKMSLIAHIVPSTGGAGHTVRAASPVHHGRFFVVLRESGDLYVFSTQDGTCVASAHVDDPPLQPPKGFRDKGQYHDTCLWCGLEVVELEEIILLVASATVNTNMAKYDPEANETSERSKTVVFELPMKSRAVVRSVKLNKLFQWSHNTPVGCVIPLGASCGVIRVLVTSVDGAVSLRAIGHTVGTYPTRPRTPDPAAGSTQMLPEASPRTMITQLVEKLHVHDRNEAAVTPLADEEQALGMLELGGSLLGIRTRRVADGVMGLAWSHSCVKGFICRRNDFRILFEQALGDFVELDWIDVDLYCVIYDNRVVLYKTQPVDANGDPAAANSLSILHPSHHLILNTGPFDALAVLSPNEVIFTNTSENAQRQILHLRKSSNCDNEGQLPHILWHLPDLEQETLPTSLLPLEDDVLIQGYTDGYIRRFNLSRMCIQSENQDSSTMVSDFCMNGEITSLHIVQNQRTKDRFVISGASDGSVAFWALSPLTLCARWILFTTPLHQVIQVPMERIGPLHGCLLCVAQDGTVAVVVLDDFQFLYMIPGSAVTLNRVCLAETSLLLIYKDKRARLWDTQSKVFWRSLTQDKAEELLSQGGWTEIFLERQNDGRSTIKAISDGLHAPDAASSLMIDLERFLSDSATVMKAISTNREQTKAIYSKLVQIRMFLSFLLTTGLNDGIDDICRTGLHIPTSSALLGFFSLETSALYPLKSGRDAWCVSGVVSAARLVAIVAVLRTLGLFEEYMDNVKTVAAFYMTSLPSCVGADFQEPNLCYLALLWLKSSGMSELRQSCHSAFDAVATRLSDDEANVIMEHWQHQLPSLQSNSDKELTSSALALFLCGHIVVEKYSIVSSEVLRDISKSVALYLQDDKSLYRVLAIDLCSRGFHIWQHYIDAMEILRSLFNLATSSRKDSIDIQNVAPQARSAVLLIASNNTPLFMTTLGLDILNPPTLEHRRSVLQIVAFLIRKRPLVLQPHLPRLMEAVVKSLDPIPTTNRDAVLDIATEIIAQVVKTFPNVDFHGASQRLAVGSYEGAIIMYDVKTATRLYVLEGHKKKLTSCCFSPDGRRLVTVSLDEGLLHVWKVGSSFVSFFTPGVPPRQGHSNSQPYKTLNFHLGDISEYSNSLDVVKFEWVTDRNVRVKIGPNTLFFGT